MEGLLKSLDEPDRRLDEIWVEEAEKRLKAYREGRLEGIQERVLKVIFSKYGVAHRGSHASGDCACRSINGFFDSFVKRLLIVRRRYAMLTWHDSLPVHRIL